MNTLLSVVQDLAGHDDYPDDASRAHPFHSTFDASARILRAVLDATQQLSSSLDAHITAPYTDQKLVSLLRQHTGVEHSIHQYEHGVRQTLSALRKRAAVSNSTHFGEDIPADRAVRPDWAVARLESWGKAAHMDAFREEEKDGRLVLILAGKVLVVDIALSIRRTDDPPTIAVASVKHSLAGPGGAETSAGGGTDGSTSLDGFLATSVHAFLHEVQKGAEDVDVLRAASLARSTTQQLEYLMRLDAIAAKIEGAADLQWFTSMDVLAAKLETSAKAEAEAVCSALSLTQAPLDIFLARAHALPLPYLACPSLSFLVYISSAVYLSLLRGSPIPTPPHQKLPHLDVPFANLRDALRSGDHKGATLVNLRLVPRSATPELEPGAPSNRPSFPLATAEVAHDLPAADGFCWVLDFTDARGEGGLVVSRSRVREMEGIVLSSNTAMDIDDFAMSMVGLSGGASSWVDLLLNTNNPMMVSERYTSLYVSPSGKHPPLQLRLLAPTEPGFVVQHVPVRNVKEIWSVLEIAREQCWLNEMLAAREWVPEGFGASADLLPEDATVTEAELEAVLSGTITPRRIPVTVGIPPGAPAQLRMSAPDLAPAHMHTPGLGSGAVEAVVAHDPARARGVRVQLEGAAGMIWEDVLEEMCRRGGALGIVGRLWEAARR